MLRVVRTAGALLVLAASSAGAQRAGDGVADSVAALIRSYDAGWDGRDTAVVGRLMAPDYQYFTSRGSVRSRAEMLAFLASPEYRLERANRSEVDIRVSGPVAVASTRWRGAGTFRGERFTDDQRCGLVWLRSAGGWRLLSEHCTQITEAPAL